VIAISAVIDILIAIVVFGVLIFVHEFGHFMAAKACGIKVNEFAIGMGPKIFGFHRGETLFSLRALPIGGFCAMEGEDSESEDERSYTRSPRWQRAIVLVAGAFMNILIGFIIILILVCRQSALASTTVAQFSADATSSSQMKAGDRILSINGWRTNIGTDIQFSLMLSSGTTADITVERAGKSVALNDVQFPTIDDGRGGKVMEMDFYVYGEKNSVRGALYHAGCWTVAVVKLVWVSLAKLVTGSIPFKSLSGPVGVTAAMGQAASQGATILFYIAAMIAINLGVVNLLPLPALDGGKLFLLIIEAIRRKPLNPKYEGWVNFAGFALLMLLMVAVTFNDIAALLPK
jgi:regulator of sigma E protease